MRIEEVRTGEPSFIPPLNQNGRGCMGALSDLTLQEMDLLREPKPRRGVYNLTRGTENLGLRELEVNEIINEDFGLDS